jgi:hypothetical protein
MIISKIFQIKRSILNCKTYKVTLNEDIQNNLRCKSLDISARKNINSEEVKLINTIYYPLFLLDRR